jgi:Uncharacterised protein family (UPF0175)
MAQVEIDLPEDVFSTLGVGFDQLGTELLETAAVKWYEVGRVSREIAARIAGISECDFLSLIPPSIVQERQTMLLDLRG